MGWACFRADLPVTVTFAVTISVMGFGVFSVTVMAIAAVGLGAFGVAAVGFGAFAIAVAARICAGQNQARNASRFEGRGHLRQSVQQYAQLRSRLHVGG